MAHVTVISEFQLSQQIATGHHRLTADEPLAPGLRKGIQEPGLVQQVLGPPPGIPRGQQEVAVDNDQLVVCHDVDRPRNLVKAVTVE